MGQIIIPTDKNFKGPWFLDVTALEELHECLTLIQHRFDEAYNISLEKTAEYKIDDYRRWQKDITIEQATEKLRNSYPFDKSEIYALMLTKEGKKIKDDTLLHLLKDSKINDFSPEELIIQMEKGPYRFSLEISTRFEGEFSTRIKVPDDVVFNDINYEITKWVDKYKPNIVLQKWASWFPILAFILLIQLFLIPLLFLKDRSDLYQTQLAQEGINLLKDSLTTQETTKAIEIILQKESGYVPPDFNPSIGFNDTIRNIWIIGGIILVILAISPKSIIGIGKNTWKVKFYKKWAYFVLFFIPLSIAIPILINKIS